MSEQSYVDTFFGGSYAVGKGLATVADLNHDTLDDLDTIDAVAADKDAMDAISGSSTAMDAVAPSETAMDAVSTSQTAMDAVAASETAMDAVAASETAMDAVSDSQMAMDSIDQVDYAVRAIMLVPAGMGANDYNDVDAVAASETAMEAVTASEAAMDAVSTSQTAMEAVMGSTLARTAFLGSEHTYTSPWSTTISSERIWHHADPDIPYTIHTGTDKETEFRFGEGPHSNDGQAIVCDTKESFEDYESGDNVELSYTLDTDGFSDLLVYTEITNDNNDGNIDLEVDIDGTNVFSTYSTHSWTERSFGLGDYSGEVEVVLRFNLTRSTTGQRSFGSMKLV